MATLFCGHQLIPHRAPKMKKKITTEYLDTRVMKIFHLITKIRNFKERAISNEVQYLSHKTHKKKQK